MKYALIGLHTVFSTHYGILLIFCKHLLFLLIYSCKLKMQKWLLLIHDLKSTMSSQGQAQRPHRGPSGPHFNFYEINIFLSISHFFFTFLKTVPCFDIVAQHSFLVQMTINQLHFYCFMMSSDGIFEVKSQNIVKSRIRRHQIEMFIFPVDNHTSQMVRSSKHFSHRKTL